MDSSPLLQQLMQSLRCLPGVGEKTSQRMAYHLLENEREGAARLAKTMVAALERIGHCTQCRTLTEHDVCEICSDRSRDDAMLCIVENPADVQILENSTDFKGYYFVLMGKLSPLDGVGPADLGLDKLAVQLNAGRVQEIILATNSTIEGEVTAHYISEMAASRDIKTTRIAQGIPMGGELEYIDSQTLSHAISSRTRY